MNDNANREYRQKLAELFSGYRAEWIDEEIFNLFTEPAYFPQLTTSHPCFLVGGRGTGKTTALRCLSYQGQEALATENGGKVSEWEYYGMYHRVNTNRVRAFGGSELSQLQWMRLFGHYINLELCELALDFLDWYVRKDNDAQQFDVNAIRRISLTLHLPQTRTLAELRNELDSSKLRFEASINNIAEDSDTPLISLQGAPIDVLFEEIKRLPQFSNKSFFFLIDEYENLSDFQQRVLNTLVKHCGSSYTFKIGVRELGFRERTTTNEAEQLAYPADYNLINITDALRKRFAAFAASVCERRLYKVLGGASTVPPITRILPGLTPEEEACRLGVGSAIKSTVTDLQENKDHGEEFRNWLDRVEDLEVFAADLRARAEGKSVANKILEVLDNPEKWKEQYGNYRHAYLFTIRKGKRGIRKYFAGWRVYCTLAASNIRYLLELVDQALTQHLDEGNDLVNMPVDASLQTKAAQDTGHRNLRELEGLSLGGAKLVRLLLGLGRVFQIMAEQPIGHTPEVSQFHLDASVKDKDQRERVEELLKEGIMHLALLRFSGSKLQDQTDIRQFDYSVHPIFSAFFGFSYRRKRKLRLDDREICDLVDRPKIAIGAIVSRQNRTMVEELPEQMNLFSDYYGTSNN